MTAASELLVDAFGRIHDVVHSTVDGLSTEQLAVRLDADANSIAWLIWHLTRVQDDHIADVADREQRWTAGGWVEEFGLPFDADALGYGQSSAEVGELAGVTAERLLNYFDEVHEYTLGYLRALSDRDLDRVVDDAWDPPVTLAVRLVSVISDDLQHAGQAAYVKGIVQRRG